MIKWLREYIDSFFVRTMPTQELDERMSHIRSEQARALSESMSCGNSIPEHLRGEVLQVEELPDCFFNGEPTMVARKSDGKVFSVCMSTYDKELQGEVVTVQEGDSKFFDLSKEYFDLNPGEYDVITRYGD